MNYLQCIKVLRWSPIPLLKNVTCFFFLRIYKEAWKTHITFTIMGITIQRQALNKAHFVFNFENTIVEIISFSPFDVTDLRVENTSQRFLWSKLRCDCGLWNNWYYRKFHLFIHCVNKDVFILNWDITSVKATMNIRNTDNRIVSNGLEWELETGFSCIHYIG